MGRGRGKAKKSTVNDHDDPGSGEEEKMPVQKRRGRPQKPLKEDIDEEEVDKLEEKGARQQDSIFSGLVTDLSITYPSFFRRFLAILTIFGNILFLQSTFRMKIKVAFFTVE